ncbi:MAG: addiction module protein [Cellulomonas sp.]|jgi:putative addiction module component (TIGR02574 family)|nr:addiction module protein [Cellulomonas sp.]
MVSNELLESVAALSVDERIELIAHIEHTLDDQDAAPDAHQHALVERRVAQMRADPTLGVSLDEHLDAVRTLTA